MSIEKNNICKHDFSADIAEVFNIVTANVYQNHEVFLRELVSNASDACEKIYLEASKDSEKTGVINRSDLKIEITIDKKNKTLIISDNGIGMNYEDLMSNLGTIASSGTKKFFKENLDGQKANSNLIGQFGIGFYSAFLVASNVNVRTKKFDSTSMFEWKSSGVSGFEISEIENDSGDNWLYNYKNENENEESSVSKKKHGTEIILHIKDSEDQYLTSHRIKYLIDLYSKNIPFDIVFREIAENSEEAQECLKGEVLNEEKAIWVKNKADITEEDYANFFKQVAGAWSDSPWSTMHSRVEGESNYTYLLFIPKTVPFMMADPDRKTSVKLHVNKIFVTEEASIIPKYLRFVKGIVDSYDLPLNVSRETVQQSYLIQRMNNYLTKKIIGELKYLANNEEKKHEYETIFWKNFGATLKEGLCEPLNTEARENILDICLFASSKRRDKLISLKEYIDAMLENQEEIFYITGSSVEEIMRDPQIEGFLENGIEVLLLTDGVDDFWLNTVLEYKGKKLKSISQTDIDIQKILSAKKEETDKKDENEECKLKENEDMNDVIEFFKETLGEAVRDVLISKKLSSSPACLGIAEGGMNMKMERFLIDQKQIQSKSQKIFEINKNHSLIQKIKETLESSKESCDESLKDELKSKIWNLFDFVCITQGEELFDSKAFSIRAGKILENL